MRRYDLTDFEWRVIEPLLPNKPRGVPRVDAGCPFEDTRVTVQCCDVVDLLCASEHDFDLILLDVDNGPVKWTQLRGPLGAGLKVEATPF